MSILYHWREVCHMKRLSEVHGKIKRKVKYVLVSKVLKFMHRFFLSLKIFLMYWVLNFIWKAETELGRKLFHLLTCSPHACSSLDWANPKSGAWSCMWVSCVDVRDSGVWAIICCLPGDALAPVRCCSSTPFSSASENDFESLFHCRVCASCFGIWDLVISKTRTLSPRKYCLIWSFKDTLIHRRIRTLANHRWWSM